MSGDPSGNYRFGLPVQASTFAGDVDRSLNILHIGMILIFVLWAAFFVYCLVRFRQGRQGKADHKGWTSAAASFLPDALVLTFELWLIFALGMPVWSKIKKDFPKPEDSHVVEMVAQQFSWGFQYAGPDGIFGKKAPQFVSVTNQLGIDPADPAGKDDLVFFNELHVPLGKPTLLNMTSKDVIHSFFVPEFRVKQDTVPGMRIPLWFEPTKAGLYEIGCAQLCGVGHYVMRADLVVQSPEEYQAWLDAQSAARLAGQPAATATSDWSD
jgi:cytochrome c oxidase subunit II